MRTVSQRELRNENAAVIRAVEAGETLTVTRRGVPVAQIGPIADDADLRLVRPARHRLDVALPRRISSRQATSEVLTDLRGER